eukprot:CAMPEP_0168505162 /NCGR_PEP_ID=MMETSP0228-20121227/76732_1 /TAXON_ID=133427 /ORGANISM="Protoceratium reticulatum, Strain CCCM 535 (=CCMP 1889)" /LENGTH=60 /DNA_ID=CAMNT_0008522247 /DNA_START=157 /DNA_END=336 /DNA_ORIENTATION=-
MSASDSATLETDLAAFAALDLPAVFFGAGAITLAFWSFFAIFFATMFAEGIKCVANTTLP